jgi:hypothetical protein
MLLAAWHPAMSGMAIITSTTGFTLIGRKCRPPRQDRLQGPRE